MCQALNLNSNKAQRHVTGSTLTGVLAGHSLQLSPPIVLSLLMWMSLWCVVTEARETVGSAVDWDANSASFSTRVSLNVSRVLVDKEVWKRATMLLCAAVPSCSSLGIFGWSSMLLYALFLLFLMNFSILHLPLNIMMYNLGKVFVQVKYFFQELFHRGGSTWVLKVFICILGNYLTITFPCGALIWILIGLV